MAPEASSVPPEIQFYQIELKRALAENSFGIQSYKLLDHDNSLSDAQKGCEASIMTLEGKQVMISFNNDGYKLAGQSSYIYDTLDSLLINHSPSYVQKVNEALTDKLNAIMAQRESNEENVNGQDQIQGEEKDERS